MSNKKLKNLLKKILPILGAVLSLFISIVLFTPIFKSPDKNTERSLILYQQQFAPMFFEERNDIYNQPAPQLEPVLGANNEISHYQAQNSSFTVKIPAENYQEPFIFERKGYQLSIVPKGVEGRKDKSVYFKIPTLFPTAQAQNNPSPIYYLIYKDAHNSIDVVKKIIPNGVKEAIILKSEKAPKQFEFVLNISDSVEVKKEPDGSIRFYSPAKASDEGGSVATKHSINGLVLAEPDYFLFRIPAPFMIDINKQKSTNCEWQLNKINDNQYNLVLIYNPANLNYPIAIDPSITDTYNDESKIAAKSNTEVTGGQVKLQATSGWYSTSWSHRKKITINSTVVSESDNGEFNFPVMINLASDSSVANAAQSDGDDILFTSSNGTSKIDHEIEKYDNQGDLIAWVEAPSLPSTSNTELYMYYGNSGAANQENVSGSWDSNYIGVWHMDNDTTSSISESTSYGMDGAKYAANQPIQYPDGKIGNAQNFDGSDDTVNIPDHANWTLSSGIDRTLEGWFNFSTLPISGDWDTIIGCPTTMYSMQFGYSTGVYLNWWDGADDHPSPNISISTGVWYHFVLTLDFGVTNGSHWYLDGKDLGTFTAGNVSRNPTALKIGAGADSLEQFTGRLDDVRISNALRSAYWISNEYNNIASSSAFYGVGNEENLYPSLGTITSTNLLSGQSASSIDSFNYNAFSIPAGTELEIQFSKDNNNWYSTSGSLNQWDTLTNTGGETLDLSGLGWSGITFYYRMQFGSTIGGDATVLLDSIALNYTAAATKTQINTPITDRFKDSSLVLDVSFNGPDIDWSTNTAYDRSGQSNNGTISGATSAIGINGQALEFDGVNDVISTASDFIGTSAATFSAWIYARNFSNTESQGIPYIISNMTSILDFDSNYSNRITYSSDGYETYTAGHTAISANNPCALNTWCFITVTRNSSGTANIYVNGTLSGSANQNSGTPAAGSTNVYIGASPYTSREFQGIIDEVRVYNRMLSASEIQNLYRAGAARVKANTPITQTLTSGLVGNWTFNGQDVDWSTNTAYDRSTQSNNGTISGATPAAGINGQALSFDGSNDYVYAPDMTGGYDFAVGASFTILAWIKPNTNGSGQGIIIKEGSSGPNYAFEIALWGSGGQLGLNEGGGGAGAGDVISAAGVTAGVWSHVAAVKNGTTITFYINGASSPGDSSWDNLGATDGNLNIGQKGSYLYSSWFNGLIDEARIYNRALSASEIQNLYRAGSRRVKPTL